MPGHEVGPGRVVREPVPAWPGRGEPVVTGPRESRLLVRWACAKRVRGNAHRHKKKVRWLSVCGSVWDTSGRTPMEKGKLGWGTGAKPQACREKNIWTVPKRRVH